MANELFEAIKAGRAEDATRMVRENPSLLSARDANGASPILLAVYYGKRDIANALADAAGSIDLFEACALGRVNRINELLRQDPSLVSAYAPDGFPPVGLAAFFGHLDAVKTLVAAGADVRAAARNPLKVQAIHAAVASKNIDIVRAVLEAGADANAAQQQGFRPMHEAAGTANRALAELLLKHGADPSLADESGKSIADYAREKGHAEFASWLESPTR